MIIAPSVLSLDYSKFSEQLSTINENCEWLHFDVMDGHFVPNLSFGPKLLKDFRKCTSLFLDVHIMVSDPFYYTDVFADAGADGITFHYEALNGDLDKCKELITYIKSKYLKAGISINPGTPVELIEPLLKEVDLVLIMSVEPGYGGQEFMHNSLNKVEYLKNYKLNNNLNYLIEVDGGVNDKNAHDLNAKGADVLVAGSFVFNGDIESNIEKLRNSTN